MILQELSDAIGVSGHEDAVRKIIAEAVRDHVDELRSDTIGNLFAVRLRPLPREKRRAARNAPLK